MILYRGYCLPVGRTIPLPPLAPDRPCQRASGEKKDVSRITAEPESLATARPGWLSVYLELGKARLSALVVLTTAMGYLLAAGPVIDWVKLAWTVIGTTLAAMSANTINQIIEVSRDAKMNRTAGRPLPSGRISVRHASIVAFVTAGTGLSILLAFTNSLTAAMGLGALLLYVFAYTPLKVRTSLNTVVGAIVGALPPLMGWAAATGRVDVGAYFLGALLLTWQIPHFLALAWLYREDYKRGGFVMLSTVDPEGRITGFTVVLWSLALIPISLATILAGLSSWLYVLGALPLGIWLLSVAWRMHRHRTDEAARKLFVASIIYMLVLMGLLAFDRLVSFSLIEKATPSTVVARQP
jgi:protoheme IX farnesyltransferase